MASEELPPDTLERTRLQRAGLRQAIVNVEVALATPAVSGRAPVWVTDVGAALYRLRGALEHHIEVTEDADGILAQIVQLAPRLAGPCDRLRQEHVELKGLLEGESSLFDGAPAAPDSMWVEGRRRDITHVLGRLASHRQQGADLTYEAYGVDIGGET